LQNLAFAATLVYSIFELETRLGMAKITGEKILKIVGLILFWLGMVGFIYTVRLGIETRAQSNWPTVEGSVIKAEFEKVITRQAIGDGSTSETREEAHWLPHFEYAYEVNGQKYIATRISTFDSTCDNEREVMDLRRLISRNQTIVVYYDPENPAFSVINPFPDLIDNWILLISSVALIFVGLVMTWVCRNA
jgi:hypothetical protein